jgi:hypothetical protein
LRLLLHPPGAQLRPFWQGACWREHRCARSQAAFQTEKAALIADYERKLQELRDCKARLKAEHLAALAALRAELEAAMAKALADLEARLKAEHAAEIAALLADAAAKLAAALAALRAELEAIIAQLKAQAERDAAELARLRAENAKLQAEVVRTHAHSTQRIFARMRIQPCMHPRMRTHPRALRSRRDAYA